MTLDRQWEAHLLDIDAGVQTAMGSALANPMLKATYRLSPISRVVPST